jgi:hypothetical protein
MYHNNKFVEHIDSTECGDLIERNFNSEEFLRIGAQRIYQIDSAIVQKESAMDQNFISSIEKLVSFEYEMLEKILKRLKIHYLGVKIGLEKIQNRLKQLGL